MRFRVYRIELHGPDRLIYEGTAGDEACPYPFRPGLAQAEAVGLATGATFRVGRGTLHFAVVAPPPLRGGRPRRRPS